MEERLLNKKEFIKEAAKRSHLSEYAVNEIYNVSCELVAEALIHGDSIEIPKLGTFLLYKKKGKNLFGSSGDTLKLCVYPAFKIGTGLKQRIKNGYSYLKNS